MFKKVVLTESSQEEEKAERDDTPVPSEPSSEEESDYEYDVLLYLKEDKERRKKTVKTLDINCCRKYL